MIGGRAVGPGHPPYIVAEISANHQGDITRALEIMEAAREAGADAVKLQTYTPDSMTIDHDGPGFRVEGGLWHGRTLYDLYAEAQTPYDWHGPLFEKGRELGLAVFSTPFDPSAVDFLETFHPPAYKIASFEAVDLPLIERSASTGKPLIVSTGLASLGEIGAAVGAARRAGNGGLVLLHCVSGYPAPAKDINLRTIANLSETFNVVTGLSDHTLGTEVAVAAVALGASLIEKHVTMRRADGGVDSAFSIEPAELAQLVRGCHIAFEALGEVNYDIEASEAPNLVFRRSLYAVADIAEGEVLTDCNVRAIRPGYGLPPQYIDDVLGRRAACAIARGTPLRWTVLKDDE
jgi:N-acetylneuraminate synthase